MNNRRSTNRDNQASQDRDALSQLCLACGICCNGVLFKDVVLQLQDDDRQWPKLASIVRGRQRRLAQPCPALGAGNVCRIYAERPTDCRHFECLLYKAVQAGRLKSEAARTVIQTALKRAERVRKLLTAMGNHDTGRALSLRFKATRRQCEAGHFDDAATDIFGELTLAVHDLNVLLQEAFYPG
jgi:uncharacterized protein